MPGRLGTLIADANGAISMLQMNSAGDSNDAEIAAGHDCASILRQLVDYVTEHGNAGAYTRERVEWAANAAANMIQDEVFGFESSETVRIQSHIDVVVNGTLYLLDHPHPGITLNEILNACWQVDDQHCRECGEAVFQDNENAAWHHGRPGAIAYGTDDDHTPVPEPADAAEMVRGWLDG